ncbi:MAG: tetratricopeptide repeat protein [Planctomycetota bacterium]|jgi:tetratricopeptide (TPR) repeat protein
MESLTTRLPARERSDALRQAIKRLRAAQEANEGHFYAQAHHHEATLRETLATLEANQGESARIRQETIDQFRKDAGNAAPALFNLGRAQEANGLYEEAIHSYRSYRQWLSEHARRMLWQFSYEGFANVEVPMPHALNRSDQWERGCTHDDQRLYLFSGDHDLQCLDLKTGSSLWSISLSGEENAKSPLDHIQITDGILYALANTDLFRVDARNGEILTHHKLAGTPFQGGVKEIHMFTRGNQLLITRIEYHSSQFSTYKSYDPSHRIDEVHILHADTLTPLHPVRKPTSTTTQGPYFYRIGQYLIRRDYRKATFSMEPELSRGLPPLDLHQDHQDHLGRYSCHALYPMRNGETYAAYFYSKTGKNLRIKRFTGWNQALQPAAEFDAALVPHHKDGFAIQFTRPLTALPDPVRTLAFDCQTQKARVILLPRNLALALDHPDTWKWSPWVRLEGNLLLVQEDRLKIYSEESGFALQFRFTPPQSISDMPILFRDTPIILTRNHTTGEFTASRLNPKQSPGSVYSDQALYREGICLSQLQRPKEALECFRNAIDENPNFSDAVYAAAEVALTNHRPQEAWGYAEQFFRVSPPLEPRRAILWEKIRRANGVLLRTDAVWWKRLRIQAEFHRAITATATGLEIRNLQSGHVTWRDASLPPSQADILIAAGKNWATSVRPGTPTSPQSEIVLWDLVKRKATLKPIPKGRPVPIGSWAFLDALRKHYDTQPFVIQDLQETARFRLYHPRTGILLADLHSEYPILPVVNHSHRYSSFDNRFYESNINDGHPFDTAVAMVAYKDRILLAGLIDELPRRRLLILACNPTTGALLWKSTHEIPPEVAKLFQPGVNFGRRIKLYAMGSRFCITLSGWQFIFDTPTGRHLKTTAVWGKNQVDATSPDYWYGLAPTSLTGCFSATAEYTPPPCSPKRWTRAAGALSTQGPFLAFHTISRSGLELSTNASDESPFHQQRLVPFSDGILLSPPYLATRVTEAEGTDRLYICDTAQFFSHLSEEDASDRPPLTLEGAGYTGPTVERYATTRLEESLAMARQSNRGIYLVVTRPGCGWCDHLTQKLMPDPTLKKFMAEMAIPVITDRSNPKDRAITTRYPYRGAPLVCLLDGNGKTIATLKGSPRTRDDLLIDLVNNFRPSTAKLDAICNSLPQRELRSWDGVALLHYVADAALRDNNAKRAQEVYGKRALRQLTHRAAIESFCQFWMKHNAELTLAQAAAEKLIDLAPNNATYHQWLSRVHARQGASRNALTSQKKAVALLTPGTPGHMAAKERQSQLAQAVDALPTATQHPLLPTAQTYFAPHSTTAKTLSLSTAEVTLANAGSTAYRLGLRNGDRVVAFQGVRVFSPFECTIIRKTLPLGTPEYRLTVLRNGQQHRVRFPIHPHQTWVPFRLRHALPSASIPNGTHPLTPQEREALQSLPGRIQCWVLQAMQQAPTQTSTWLTPLLTVAEALQHEASTDGLPDSISSPLAKLNELYQFYRRVEAGRRIGGAALLPTALGVSDDYLIFNYPYPRNDEAPLGELKISDPTLRRCLELRHKGIGRDERRAAAARYGALILKGDPRNPKAVLESYLNSLKTALADSGFGGGWPFRHDEVSSKSERDRMRRLLTQEVKAHPENRHLYQYGLAYLHTRDKRVKSYRSLFAQVRDESPYLANLITSMVYSASFWKPKCHNAREWLKGEVEEAPFHPRMRKDPLLRRLLTQSRLMQRVFLDCGPFTKGYRFYFAAKAGLQRDDSIDLLEARLDLGLAAPDWKEQRHILGESLKSLALDLPSWLDNRPYNSLIRDREGLGSATHLGMEVVLKSRRIYCWGTEAWHTYTDRSVLFGSGAKETYRRAYADLQKVRWEEPQRAIQTIRKIHMRDGILPVTMELIHALQTHGLRDEAKLLQTPIDQFLDLIDVHDGSDSRGTEMKLRVYSQIPETAKMAIAAGVKLQEKKSYRISDSDCAFMARAAHYTGDDKLAQQWLDRQASAKRVRKQLFYGGLASNDFKPFREWLEDKDRTRE